MPVNLIPQLAVIICFHVWFKYKRLQRSSQVMF